MAASTDPLATAGRDLVALAPDPFDPDVQAMFLFEEGARPGPHPEERDLNRLWSELTVANQLRLWAASVAGVTLGGSAVEIDRAAPWWVAVLVAVAAISCAIAVGTLAGHLHGRRRARREGGGGGEVPAPVDRVPGGCPAGATLEAQFLLGALECAMGEGVDFCEWDWVHQPEAVAVIVRRLAVSAGREPSEVEDLVRTLRP